MLKKINWLLQIMLALLLMSAVVAIADDEPSPPHRFRGFAIDENGDLAIDGTIISAQINNDFYNTSVIDGKYGFPSLTEEYQVHGSEGETIYFSIYGADTGQTAVFTVGGLNIDFMPYLNLSLDWVALTIDTVGASTTPYEAVISWTTNRVSTSTVQYGNNIDDLSYTKDDSEPTKDHFITISNLPPNTKYYYEVISKDPLGNTKQDNNSGNYYTFTTDESSDPPSGGPSNGPGGSMTPPDITGTQNIYPVADANGPYYSDVNEIIYFDASNSYDSDGYITNYTWDFGDGTTISVSNVYTTHIYLHGGNYSVFLTVTDNNGSTNYTTTSAYISANDADGDGWSDEAELYYGTDPDDAMMLLIIHKMLIMMEFQMVLILMMIMIFLRMMMKIDLEPIQMMVLM